jgi:hypothetical protein
MNFDKFARNLEQNKPGSGTLQQRLAQYGLQEVSDFVRDARCQFSAIAQQLSQKLGLSIAPETLREFAVDWLRHNSESEFEVLCVSFFLRLFNRK